MKKKFFTILTVSIMSSAAISQNFQEVNYSNLNNGKGTFADIDNDGDLDIFQYSGDFSGSYLSTNDGNGVFTLSSNFPLANDGVALFLDVDNDNDVDLFLSGGDGFTNIGELYLNDGNGNFTLVTGSPFAQSFNSSADYADIDNDGDLDIILAGQIFNGSGYNYGTVLYTNDGNGNFTEVLGTSFIASSYGSVDFADIDNDNDMDVLITGYDGINFLTNLYTNDGSGNFTSVAHPFPNLAVSDVCFFDIDGDSDLDILLSGDANYNSPTPTTALYKNDGSGNFSLVSNTPFINLVWSSIDFADIDNDNDLDVIILGDSSTVIPTNMDYITTLYTNDGNGNFSIDNSTQFPAVSLGSVAFADVDNNGYPDLQFTGSPNMFMNNICLTDLTVSVNNGAVLSANESGATYQWLDCNNGNAIIAGETSQTFSPSSNGSYSVIITTGFCVDTSQCMTVSSVGLNDVDEVSFDLYPNPTSGKVSIKLDNNDNSEVIIYNVNGETVYSNLFNKNITFNLNEAPGVYFIEIKSKETIKKMKLIKL